MGLFIKKFLTLIIVTCISSNITQCSIPPADCITKKNVDEYNVVASAATMYLAYTYQKGADANNCSPNGARICKTLKTDLITLYLKAYDTFKKFDMSGDKESKTAFVNSLIALFQYLLPSLPRDEQIGCTSMIKNIKATIQ